IFCGAHRSITRTFSLLPYSDDTCFIAAAWQTHDGHHAAINQSTRGFPLNDSKDICFPSTVFKLKSAALLLYKEYACLVDPITAREITNIVTTVAIMIIVVVFDFNGVLAIFIISRPSYSLVQNNNHLQ